MVRHRWPLQKMRTLLLGFAAGIVPIGVAGCVVVADDAATIDAQVLSPRETALAERALRRRDVASVQTFIARYPRSARVPDVLNAISPRTRARLSPSVLAAVPASTLDRLTPAARAQLAGLLQDNRRAGSRTTRRAVPRDFTTSRIRQMY